MIVLVSVFYDFGSYTSAEDWGAGEEEEDEEECEDEEMEAFEVEKKKKKKNVIVEQKVKKAHLNLIFIGHVGECLLLNICHCPEICFSQQLGSEHW